MPTYVLATFNRDKGRELAALFAAPGRALRFLYEFAGATPPEETGATLIDNARIKARSAVAHTGMVSIADDTGLEVDALDGEPGPHAARFAGPNATYADNVALLLERLRGVPRARRTARFHSVCIAIDPDGRERVGEGVLEGVITESPRGVNGFGYDPVFEVVSTGRTLAEMDEDAKNALSHRALAASALSQRLDE